jgi:hypothetical protein
MTGLTDFYKAIPAADFFKPYTDASASLYAAATSEATDALQTVITEMKCVTDVADVTTDATVGNVKCVVNTAAR